MKVKNLLGYEVGEILKNACKSSGKIDISRAINILNIIFSKSPSKLDIWTFVWSH